MEGTRGEKLFFELIQKVKKLRDDPITGIDFEHKLMEKWLSENTGATCEKVNLVTYSTFEEDDKRVKVNDDYAIMTNTEAYQDLWAEYKAVKNEGKREGKRNNSKETCIRNGIGWRGSKCLVVE